MLNWLIMLIIVLIIVLIAVSIIRVAARFLLKLGIFALLIFLAWQVLHFVR